MFFWWLVSERKIQPSEQDFAFVGIDFLSTITLGEMYAFISHCQFSLNSSAGTRARKIVSIRQFWKYLKSSRLLTENVAEELETPKQPKRLPRYLTLEESVRLLIASKLSPRDHCILTLLLNCALRVSELEALNCSQISADILSVIGKGNKERKIYLTPAAKSSIATWMETRSSLPVETEALFISRNNQRMTVRSLQTVVKKYAQMAGFDNTEISAHTLRHTSATLMYKYGKLIFGRFSKFLVMRALRQLKYILILMIANCMQRLTPILWQLCLVRMPSIFAITVKTAYSLKFRET